MHTFHLKYRASPIVFTLFCCIILFSCTQKKHSEKKIFRYNQPEGISSLDPAFAKNQAVMWGVHQLFNTLVAVDEHLQITPSLCKSWSVSKDGLTYTFILRNDVYFHANEAFAGGRGRKLVASDVVYSLQRIITPATASPGAWIFNHRVDAVNGFSAPDDTTFQLKLLRPFPPIIGILSMPYCSIIPHEVVEKQGIQFGRQPCGTGPFRFTRWEEGQILLMAKNENYFEYDNTGNRLPYIDGIRISFLDNKATEFLEFTQGKLDFVNDIDASFKDEVFTKTGELRKEWQGKINLTKHSFLNTEYLGFLSDTNSPLLKNHPLGNKAVRQAINYGFDRKKMMMYLRNSLGIPAVNGFIPAGMPSFDSAKVIGYDYNVPKARQLLEKAGFPGGERLPVIKLLTIPLYAELGSFVAKQLEDIGIKIQVEVVQKSVLLEQTAKSQALFFRGSWMADYPDAENYLSVFYSRNPAPPNYTRYNNPEYDKLYDKALLEENDSTRFELYRQMDNLILADAPIVPLWYDMVIRLSHPRIRNFIPNSLNIPELKRVIIEK